jgi:hypothetical protein
VSVYIYMNKYNDTSTLPPEEYHGRPRPKQRLPLAPTDAAGWASRAFHASLSSEKALQEATGGSAARWSSSGY